MFLTRENDIFAFQNIAITTRERRNLTDSVSGSPSTLSKKHQTEQHNDSGLRTADCGQRILVHTSVKKLSCPYSNS